MTGLTRSPLTSRGSLVAIDATGPVTAVAFQYNPDEMTRTLQARAATSGAGTSPGARNEALRLSGAPIETITLSVEIDATDQLEADDPLATALGIYPQLSALEMLLYPKSSVVTANTALALAGSIELVAPEAPLTLLVWGLKRVVPVRLTQFSITEQAYDPELNPIRARVQLGLRVLSYSDLPVANPGHHMFLVAPGRQGGHGHAGVRRPGSRTGAASHRSCSRWGCEVPDRASRYATVGIAIVTMPDGVGGRRTVRYLLPPVPPAARRRCPRWPSTVVRGADRLDSARGGPPGRPHPVLARSATPTR